MTGRNCTEHVAHRGDPTGAGMDCNGTNYKRAHQNTDNRTARDSVEGGGGADRPPYMHKPLVP